MVLHEVRHRVDNVKQGSNPVVVTEEATDIEGPFTESVVDQDSSS